MALSPGDKSAVSASDASAIGAIPSKATPGGAGLELDDLNGLANWELAVICLPHFEWWSDDTLTLLDLVPVVGANNRDAIERIARTIWPNWEGIYRLQFGHVCRLVRKHLKDARVKHSHEELLQRARTVLEARK